MSALAIDIGSYTIKAISGKPGEQVQVERVVEVFNTDGIVIPNDDTEIEKLATALEHIIEDNKLPIGDVRICLPENMVSTKIISIPRLTDAELASAIGWQAEQHIPIPPEELTLEYHVLYRPDRGSSDEMRVMMVGARKPVVQRFVSAIQILGIEPSVLETQTLSVIRSLQFTPEDDSALVVHMGSSTMILAIVRHGELAFVFNHMTGGSVLTKTLEQGIGLETQQAEEYKREFGLDVAQFQGKVAESLRPVVKNMTDEMLKAIRFFGTQYPQDPINRVLLSGGATQLPGMLEAVTDALGVEVLVSAPFASATGAIPEANHPALSVAMGLLMRTEVS